MNFMIFSFFLRCTTITKAVNFVVVTEIIYKYFSKVMNLNEYIAYESNIFGMV